MKPCLKKSKNCLIQLSLTFVVSVPSIWTHTHYKARTILEQCLAETLANCSLQAFSFSSGTFHCYMVSCIQNSTIPYAPQFCRLSGLSDLQPPWLKQCDDHIIRGTTQLARCPKCYVNWNDKDNPHNLFLIIQVNRNSQLWELSTGAGDVIQWEITCLGYMRSKAPLSALQK